MYKRQALDLKPISFITNESFWQTEDDVKGALNGIYVQLRGAAEHDLYIFCLLYTSQQEDCFSALILG